MNKDVGLEFVLMAMKATINILRLWTKTYATTIAYFFTIGSK
jgi:hypothetical protein